MQFQLEEINEEFYKLMGTDQPLGKGNAFNLNRNKYDQLGRSGGVNDEREPSQSM